MGNGLLYLFQSLVIISQVLPNLLGGNSCNREIRYREQSCMYEVAFHMRPAVLLIAVAQTKSTMGKHIVWNHT